MDFNTVPSSQILPVSSHNSSVSVLSLKKDAEEFFLKKNINCYRAFKNAYAVSTGNVKSKQEFVNIFVKVIEEAVLADQELTDQLAEKKLIIKHCFDIIRNAATVVNNSNVNISIENFYATVAGFLIGKLK